MSLDVVKSAGIPASAIEQPMKALRNEVFSKWATFPISQLSHHGQKCCDMARQWLIAMDYSQLNGESVLNGPRWVLARYSWGPTKWPIHWCDAVREKSLDCGAQSAIAHELFLKRGVQSFRVQLVQQFSKDATKQWCEKWKSEDASNYWIDENLIYHECNAILLPGYETAAPEIKVWDGSAGTWVSPRQANGYGSVRAIRVFTEASSQGVFAWGEHRINANSWHVLNRTEL